VQGQPRRRKKQVSIRGLNKDHNHDLKGRFKAAATRASVQPGPFQDFYQRSLAKGIKPTMVRLTLARKIAACIPIACRRTKCRRHLASVKSLCPLGQPEKALGPEPQIDPWLPHAQPHGLSVSGPDRRRRYPTKRWNRDGTRQHLTQY
jgi:hypothetical protein